MHGPKNKILIFDSGKYLAMTERKQEKSEERA